MDKKEREREFTTYLTEKFPSSTRGTSGVFHKDFGEKIIGALKDLSSVDKNLRFFVRKHKFKILNLPSLGAHDVLVVPTKHQALEDNTALGENRRVAFVEEFYGLIQEVHEKELLHAGYKKTFNKLQSMYHGIPRSAVEKFVSMCPSCQLRKPQVSSGPLRPIIAHGFFCRLQIDLIDMRHLPHGTKKWILHCVDHWSKFNFAYALDSKTAENVADILRTHIFPYFGVPRILHSDNGREFINQVIVNLLKEWHSNIQLISGRPRHPQSQGLVERAHQTLHKKLATEISTSGMKAPPWNEWLPKIIYAMNTQVHDATGASPYELVFGQRARAVFFPTEQCSIVLEEDLEDEGIQFNMPINDDVTPKESLAENRVDEQIEAEHSKLYGNEVREMEKETKVDVACSRPEESQVNDQEEGDQKLNLMHSRRLIKMSHVDSLATSLKHRNVREKADIKYLASAQKMADRYLKKKNVQSFLIGENVSLRIPRIDRASSDLSRLPCTVFEIVGGDQTLYRLRCQHGVLRVCYTANELERFNGHVICSADDWKDEPCISLREAARQQAPWNHFVSNACKCTTGCINRKCRCVRQNIKCSTYCHKSIPCCNSSQASSIDSEASDLKGPLQDTCTSDSVEKLQTNVLDDIKDCKDLKDQFFSSTLFKLMQSGSSMYNKGCVDEDMDISKYVKNPNEYGLFINPHVSVWLDSRCYENKPPLQQVFDFVIVNESLQEEFDTYVASFPSTDHCHLELGPLLKYWNMHIRSLPLSTVHMFDKQYLLLHYSDLDDICEWVLATREKYMNQKDAELLNSPLLPIVPQFDNAATDDTGCSDKLWLVCAEVQLYESDRAILENEDSWLNDRIINAAQNLLRIRYYTPGLQNTLLPSIQQNEVVGGEEFVQVLHSGGNHWITISTIGCSDSTVSIYDSIYCTIPECTKKQICALLMSSEAYINLLFVNVDKQANQSDCGLYALAFCTALCAGNDPQNLTFSAGDAMREHLKQCISRQKIEPFPCTVMARRRRVRKMERIEIICLCRSIKFGKVVQCDVCKELFHQECLTVQPIFLDNPRTQWICNLCQNS